MPISRDFEAFHKSIAEELKATKNRIRNLIGARHWPTDGGYKELILRNILRGHLSESLRVGTGFVCGPTDVSHQIDVLVSIRAKPALLRDGDLLLTTPDAVAAIIEVKTKVESDLQDVVTKLAGDVSMIRREGNPSCVAGLFFYDHGRGVDSHQRVLDALQRAGENDESRAINWLAIGPDIFIRYWNNGSDAESSMKCPLWRSYELKEMAHAYFLSNAVWDTCHSLDQTMQYAWFPKAEGKEPFRRHFISLDGQTKDYT